MRFVALVLVGPPYAVESFMATLRKQHPHVELLPPEVTTCESEHGSCQICAAIRMCLAEAVDESILDQLVTEAASLTTQVQMGVTSMEA